MKRERRTVWAWTAPGASYPPYVNFTRIDEHTVRVVVRSPAVEGREGPTAAMDIPSADFQRISEDMIAPPPPGEKGGLCVLDEGRRTVCIGGCQCCNDFVHSEGKHL